MPTVPQCHCADWLQTSQQVHMRTDTMLVLTWAYLLASSKQSMSPARVWRVCVNVWALSPAEILRGLRERVSADAQAKNVQAQKERMQTQEAEISALRRQLESMQVAASRARAVGAGRRQYDGSVPAEYICPITQVRLLHRPTCYTKHSAVLSGQPINHSLLTSSRILECSQHSMLDCLSRVACAHVRC